MIYPQNFEQKIGFDQIRQLLKDKCLSTLGEERVTDMNFSEQHEEVEEKLNQVTEFVRIIQEEDGFPDQFFFDVRPSLKRVRIEGMYLDEQELFDLRRLFFLSVAGTRQYLLPVVAGWGRGYCFLLHLHSDAESVQCHGRISRSIFL